ncbi:MAG: phospholipid carrier-dependent glycosyltransferase [Candidatus Binataceae bacterium]|nr:phospholipid carrier-dependent glycosyltransferase [Candidatus Binataceae bacterium]
MSMLSLDISDRHETTNRPFMIFAVAALALVTAAAAFPSASNLIDSGRLAGIISGCVLLGIIGYAICYFAVPLVKRSQSDLNNALLILGAIWFAKLAIIPLFPGFGPDIGSYQAWAGRIASAGPALTYAHGYFIDYPPVYLYALWAAGAIVRLTGAAGTTARVIVESPALIADLLLAATTFIYLRRLGYLAGAYAGMIMVALNPAMLFDSVVWGQSDSVMTLVLLLSVIATLEDQYELAWGLAAIAVLVKPQALALLPVLGLWTLLRCQWRRWLTAAMAFIAVGIIAIAPFQRHHPWNWIWLLYAATAAYYHETSVNAFNLMALIAGLRHPDSIKIVGIPVFDLGMGLLVPLYAFIAWVIWRAADRRTLFFASFLVIFGFFMLAPRMHERYLYPTLAFLVPLAIEEPVMLAIFAILTLTCLFNLAYVKYTLETVVFLNGRDWLAMTVSAINLLMFAIVVSEHAGPGQSGERSGMGGVVSMFARLRAATASTSEAESTQIEQSPAPLPWLQIDTIVLGLLVGGAAVVRFWHLGRPPEIVFDEVHFVAQARHYLRSEPFLDPHPPLAKLVIAAGIWLFGDHPWSWRVGNAAIGTALVGITYLLGLRMFRSRLAGAMAALFIACDGMFIVDSRTAVIDIVYVTLAAVSYLLLFRFRDQRAAPVKRRRTLVAMGAALGLCVGAKLYIPAITFLLVLGFVLYVIWSEARRARLSAPSIMLKRLLGAGLLVSAVSAIFYVATFTPHFALGWWGGIADLFHYYKDVMWYERSVTSATHPYSAPWWSWPLMLRPIAYWQNFPATGDVATIWGGGNPVLWWGALAAMMVYFARTLERPKLVLSFLVIGYIAYLVIWIPIGRTMFLYHYMPSVYLAYLALAGLLADCWSGRAQVLEEASLIMTLFPCCMLALGYVVGGLVFVAIVVAYVAVLERPLIHGRIVCAVFVGAAMAAFVYFYPLWVAMPIARAGYYARMWFQGPGLRNWI